MPAVAIANKICFDQRHRPDELFGYFQHAVLQWRSCTGLGVTVLKAFRAVGMWHYVGMGDGVGHGAGGVFPMISVP